MPDLHWQGGPGPARSTCTDAELTTPLYRLDERWDFSGFHTIYSGTARSYDAYRFTHSALGEDRIRLIQRGR